MSIAFAYTSTMTCTVVSGTIRSLVEDLNRPVSRMEACGERCTVSDMHLECVDETEDSTSRLHVSFKMQVQNIQVCHFRSDSRFAPSQLLLWKWRFVLFCFCSWFTLNYAPDILFVWYYWVGMVNFFFVILLLINVICHWSTVYINIDLSYKITLL